MNDETIVWIGIDPGGQHTGLVARKGNWLISWKIIHRDGPEPAWQYGRRVVQSVQAWRHELRFAVARYAIEDLVPVVPHVHGRPINPTPLVDTGIVLGAIAASVPADPVLVRPGGNGSNPLGTYPPALVTDGERRRKGWELRVGKSSQIRHARSAWDVVTAAQITWRLAARTRNHGATDGRTNTDHGDAA